MSKRSSLLALLLVLACGRAWAQTSPSCAQIPNAACATAADAITGPWTFAGTSPLIFDGSTAGTFANTLVVTDPTAARTFTLPNADSVAVQPLTCGSTDKVSAISALGLITCTADVGANHAILSTTHTDTLAAAVARGAIIVGNSTPAWARVTVGAANTFVHSDGTDTTFAAIAAADIGAGDLANGLKWDGPCTADPCTITAPRTTDTAVVIHQGIVLRRVATCGGINEYTISGTTLDFCDATQGVSTGVASARVIEEL